jgi:hypothetical protein
MRLRGDKSSGHGIFVATMANGDHVHYAYTNSVNLTKGMMMTGSNKFENHGRNREVQSHYRQRRLHRKRECGRLKHLDLHRNVYGREVARPGARDEGRSPARSRLFICPVSS